ncbi:DUF6328 family protein [Nocardia sp. NPDC058658]|uniref:DUF6328 family protein n=1 Tax=Nocardia sp. NPDC058658 TaxID=3346580 RepID=UPI0036602C0C
MDGKDAAWNERMRGENTVQRLDRNWSSLLQELRVLQTGVQVLTGFLLTLPFQSRFETLSTSLRVVYLVVVSAAVTATALLVAPVAIHRVLFRRHRLDALVTGSHRLVIAGIALLGVALTGMAVLIFDMVAGTTAGVIAGIVAAVLFLGLWVVQPLLFRRQRTGCGGPPPR